MKDLKPIKNQLPKAQMISCKKFDCFILLYITYNKVIKQWDLSGVKNLKRLI